MNDSFIADTGSKPTRIAVTPDDVQIIVLKQILAELRDLNARIEALSGAGIAGAASSIQIEDHPTKDRIVRLTTKIYAGSDMDVDAALETHARAHRLAEEMAMANWAQTVDALLRQDVQALPRVEP